MNEIIIRPATKADIASIQLLEQEIIRHERTIVDALKQDEAIHYYDIPFLVSDTENSLLLVVELDKQIIGCGFGEIRINEAYYKEKHFGYIGLMCVDEKHRGNGYSGMIINRLMEWFKQKGLKEVKLKVFPGNAGGIKSYSRLGFQDHMIEMKRRLY
jgi:RimJ/RimL family protein N-acetyltransferase